MVNFEAFHEDFRTISLLVPETRGEPTRFEVSSSEETLPLEIRKKVNIEGGYKYTLTYEGFIFLNRIYKVTDDLGHECELRSGEIVRTEMFDSLYYYDGDDLGVTYSKSSTTFKLWTPVAKEVNLVWKKNGAFTKTPLRYENQGVWSLTLQGDLEKTPYYYEAYVNGETRSFLDPYAVASAANGKYNYVIDYTKTHTMHNERIGVSGTDAIVYEASIRDLTRDPALNAQNPSTYSAFSTSGLKTPGGHPAGFDYLRSLGVSHIQILPFYDFEGVDETKPFKHYNWGYNPSQYNVPEGSYSTDPDDPYRRIDELKETIDKLHKAGLGVVMDVVYNHVYKVETFPFANMVPGYFYRVDKHGYLSDASGCGNDLATERRMVRKFIVDSVMHWAKEFAIDGFRFDIMGIIDLETMHFVRQKLERLDENIMVYGEGWKIPSPLPFEKLAHMHNDNALYNIGFFNDLARENIKGSTFNLKDKGYALGHKGRGETLKAIMRGSTFVHGGIKYPAQSINYVECHDDHTFYDKAKAALPKTPKKDRLKMQKLATSMVLLAQGVPFIHAGQEFYRSKKGVKNSYKSPDSVNMIHWRDVDEHAQDIDDFRRLVKLRKNHKLFRLQNAGYIRTHTRIHINQTGTMLYELFDEQEHLLCVFKNCKQKEALPLEADYELLYHSLEEPPLQERTLHLRDIGTTVLRKQKG